jgi:hypothetical protein
MPPQINLIFPGTWNILYRTCVHTVHNFCFIFIAHHSCCCCCFKHSYILSGPSGDVFKSIHRFVCVCVHTFFNLHIQRLRYITKDTLSPYPCCAKKLFPLGSRNLNQMDRRVCCRADEIWYVWDPTQSRSKALTDVGRWVPGGVNSVSADVHYYQRLYSSSILDIYNVRSR